MGWKLNIYISLVDKLVVVHRAANSKLTFHGQETQNLCLMACNLKTYISWVDKRLVSPKAANSKITIHGLELKTYISWAGNSKLTSLNTHFIGLQTGSCTQGCKLKTYISWAGNSKLMFNGLQPQNLYFMG